MYNINEIIEKLFILLETFDYRGFLNEEERNILESLKTDYYIYWAEEGHDGEE